MTPDELTLDGQSGSGSTDRKGLIVRLSEGGMIAKASGPAAPPVIAEPLLEEEARRILGRLEPLPVDAEDVQEFAFPPRSLPPPQTGTKVAMDVRAVDETEEPPPAAESGILEVLSYAPAGAVELASQLTVVFSRPMVALSSRADQDLQEVPARLSPQPPGRWRWLDPRTLIFEPPERFPMATEYAVEIPGGTKALDGSALPTATSWTFTTPPPRLVKHYPTGKSIPSEPLLFLGFDQAITPAQILPHLRAKGKKLQSAGPARLATEEEVQGDEAVRKLIEEAVPGTWLAIRFCEPLPMSTKVFVAVAAGALGSEGPLPTTAPQEFTFNTAVPLRVNRHEVGWYDDRGPRAHWSIAFSNPLDKDSLDASQIQIEPELPQCTVEVHGSDMWICGASKARTTYRLTLPDSLRDTLGRRLEGKRSLEFEVESAKPSLCRDAQEHLVLAPFEPAVFPVRSVNQPELLVRLYAVSPEVWHDFQSFLSQRHRKPNLTPPGNLVLDTVIRPEDRPDEVVETLIDLTPALPDGYGHVIVSVVPKIRRQPDSSWETICTWVQVTQTGLTAVTDGDELVVWATSLRDGKARQLRVDLLPTDVTAETSQDGLARLTIPGDRQTKHRMLVARAGNDVTILPQDYGGRGAWQRRTVPDELLWYVFSDRGVYRPGETVRFHGWLRRRTGAKSSEVRRIEKAVLVRYEVYDARRNKFTEGRIKVEPEKGFELSFTVPKEIPTGRANLYLRYPGWGNDIQERQHNEYFLIEEYRRPEYEVTVATAEGPHFVGRSATATVTAAYYAGGPLPGAEVSWHVSCKPGEFVPPGREDYTFGRWRRFWSLVDEGDEDSGHSESFSGTTDGTGRHCLKLDFQSVAPPRASVVRLEASVADVNRQDWSASSALLVHPAEDYVGLRCHRSFVREAEPISIDVIVTDLDGRLLAGRNVDCRVGRIIYDWKDGRPSEEEHEVQRLELASALDPVPLRIDGLIGGQYRVTATVTDPQGRPNMTEVQFWVAGAAGAPQRRLGGEDVELIPSKREYAPGDTAEVLVRSALFPAEGLLTVSRSGIVHTERFSMEGPTHTLGVPISEDDYPNVAVQVDLVGTKFRMNEAGQPDPSLPPQPGYAYGEVQLSVPPHRRALHVQVAPQHNALEPGGQAELEIEIRDASGRPVRCQELAAVVVDEAILALSNYDLADPLEVMYPRRMPAVAHFELRKHLIEPMLRGALHIGGSMAMAGAAVPLGCASVGESVDCLMESGEYTGARYSLRHALFGAIMDSDRPIEVRKDFNPVALFLANITTDEDGRARVPVKLPDSLTRYRVMVVAAAGENLFGKGEAAITVRLPLMVRPSAPRFLNFGDRCELPVVVQNQQETPLDVAVVVGTSNLELIAGAGRLVSVPPGDRVEVCFPISAVQPGTARFQVAAVSADGQDAARGELPVWTPASSEATAVYGQIDEGVIRQGLAIPLDTADQFGGLELSTSSTAVAALTDAVLYLVKYPFECAEQLASRVLAVAALRDVLGAFQAKGLPKPQRIELAVRKDIELLRMMQNPDGGFGFWRRGDPSWPFLSIHVLHALARAKTKGFSVPDEMIQRSLKYLKDIRRHANKYDCREVRWALEAYALTVRALLGDVDRQTALDLLDTVGLEKLPLEAVGWLLTLLAESEGTRPSVDAILRYLDNRATQTAATAHFVTAYANGAHVLLHSDRRADAILLEALIVSRPEHPLIPKIVHGLLAHRTKGRWDNTQENAFVLLALDRYFRTYEGQSPDFVARVWLGSQFAAEHRFQGRTTEQARLGISMKTLRTVLPPAEVVLAKEGPGRLYYRLGLEYVPTTLQHDAENCGFQVSRTYLAVDRPDDVRRGEDSTWHVRAGAQVRVRLELVASSRRYHVAMVDPLPAGLEPLNPALAIAPRGDSSAAPRTFTEWWKQHWFDHQNLRDDRVEVFSSLLWEGIYEYEYLARATTRGSFVVPPPRAEEMYHPETFGRGRSDRVVVE